MPRRVFLALSLVLGLSAVVSGCTLRYSLQFETSGAPLTGAEAEQLASTTDIGALASVTASDAVPMRTQVLADLRTRGDLGQRAADLLTTGFPDHTAAVPVLVRAITIDGVDAVVVVEAFSSDGSNLTHRRLWVFDRSSGAVIRAASFR